MAAEKDKTLIVFTRTQGGDMETWHGDEARYENALRDGYLTTIDWSTEQEERIPFDLLALVRVERLVRQGVRTR